MRNDTSSEATTVDHGLASSKVDWSAAKEIFAEAIDLQPAGRAAFVESRCKDQPGLHAAVRRLLASHADATDFLVADDAESETSLGFTPPGSAIPWRTTRQAQPMPPAVGPYEIIEQIGEGGHGTVYRATQHAPIEREIALKILKPGLESADLVARFADERRFLARMDHPDIVKILDAGATPDGRLFVAMELVRGTPLVDFANDESLSIKDRIDLVARIARAIHHAHQRAVIHRDLKPTNILVESDEGVPRFRIIDFGIARALADDDSDARTLRAIGTPRYMSPEQAGAGGDVDTRTDIYALGVILCELLTGKTPRPPSTGDGTRSTPSAATPPSRLAMTADGDAVTPSVLRGDLDRIVLKCVAWDPEERYTSASELADDLARYLAGQPVRATPPGSWYIARRFIGRHRLASALTAAAVLSLGLGLGLALQGQAAAIEQAKIAREATAEAERQAARAEFVSGFLLEDMLAAADPDASPGRDVTARELLDVAASRAADRFADDPAMLADVLGRVGVAYARIGRNEQARDVLTRALAVAEEIREGDASGPSAEDTLAWEFERATATLMIPGRHKEAGTVFKSLAERTDQALGQEHPLTLMAGLQASEYIEDQHERASAVEAIELTTRAAAFEGTPERMRALRYLGGTLSRAGDHERAMDAFAGAHALSASYLGTDHTQTIKLAFNLAKSSVYAGRHEEGTEMLNDTLRRAHDVYGAGHGTLTGMQRLAVAVYLRAGARDEAIAVAEDFAANAAAQYGEDSIPHVSANHELGRALIEAGRPAEGLAVLQRILPLREQQWGTGHTQTAYTVRAIADAHEAIGAWAEAAAAARRAMDALAPSSPSRYLAGATRVRALRRLGDTDGADALLATLNDEAREAGATEKILNILGDLATGDD
jgi:tetratricopeptide (TPR) repeat protein